jgi:hypothetical protein
MILAYSLNIRLQVVRDGLEFTRKVFGDETGLLRENGLSRIVLQRSSRNDRLIEVCVRTGVLQNNALRGRIATAAVFQMQTMRPSHEFESLAIIDMNIPDFKPGDGISREMERVGSHLSDNQFAGIRDGEVIGESVIETCPRLASSDFSVDLLLRSDEIGGTPEQRGDELACRKKIQTWRKL